MLNTFGYISDAYFGGRFGAGGDGDGGGGGACTECLPFLVATRSGQRQTRVTSFLLS
jgi:hypothetical protein